MCCSSYLFFWYVSLTGMKWYLIAFLICISLMLNIKDHLFYISIHLQFLLKDSFCFFNYFLLILSFTNVLYVLYINISTKWVVKNQCYGNWWHCIIFIHNFPISVKNQSVGLFFLCSMRHNFSRVAWQSDLKSIDIVQFWEVLTK